MRASLTAVTVVVMPATGRMVLILKMVKGLPHLPTRVWENIPLLRVSMEAAIQARRISHPSKVRSSKERMKSKVRFTNRCRKVSTWFMPRAFCG